MQTTAIGTVAKSLPQNKVILLTHLISNSYIPYTDLLKKANLQPFQAIDFPIWRNGCPTVASCVPCASARQHCPEVPKYVYLSVRRA